MRTQQIVFHLQNNAEEFARALAFARAQAFKWYQCEPSDIPERIFTASLGAQIVATVGVTDSYLHQPLPLQQLYDLESTQLPWNFHWDLVVQLSWFFSSIKDCFMNLLLLALNHCYHAGKRYAVLQMKDVVSLILKKKVCNYRPSAARNYAWIRSMNQTELIIRMHPPYVFIIWIFLRTCFA